MSKGILSFLAAGSMLISGTIVFAEAASAQSENAAEIGSDFRCTVNNADRTGWVTSDAKNHSVVTNDAGNVTVLACTIDGVENNTGRAVIFNNFLCRTPNGTTRNSRLIISAAGVATLACMIIGNKDKDEVPQ